jgi:peptide deformylase
MKIENSFLENYELAGESLRIYKWPSKHLSQVAIEVTDFNDELRTSIKNMLYTMYNAPGIGLAAPQVGINKRFFTLDTKFSREEVSTPDDSIKYNYSDFNPQVFINPKIRKIDGEINHEEGCLSLPGYYELVKRCDKIVIDYQDMFGNHITKELNGINSVCVQHENDHLEGIVFVDRISLMKKNLIKNKIIKERKRAKLDL